MSAPTSQGTQASLGLSQRHWAPEGSGTVPLGRATRESRGPSQRKDSAGRAPCLPGETLDVEISTIRQLSQKRFKA